MNKPDAVLEVIAQAQALYDEHGQSLAVDPEIARLMAEYQAEIDANARLMAETGLAAFCTQCAGKGDASCCFNGAENWYGETLLLVNLLMGAKMPQTRLMPRDCFFNGGKGCCLKGRWSICINFFCPELQEHLGAKKIKLLRQQAGHEIWAGLMLERALEDRLAQLA